MTKPDFYSTLGVAKTASASDIKKAYRKLAALHHPDRHQTPEAKAAAEIKFKEANEANETLSDPHKRAMYDRHGHAEPMNQRRQQSSNMNDHIRDFMNQAQANMIPHVGLRVTIEKAFIGSTVKLNIFGVTVDYLLRPGLPQGVAYMDTLTVNGAPKQVQFQVLIDTGNFRFVNAGSHDGEFFSGDLETDIDVQAIDIMLGAWIMVKDFTGKELQVRVPAGFELKHRLKVAGHGYSNWRGDKAAERGDLYLQVHPKFEPVTKMDPVKIAELYNLSRPTTEEAHV